MLQDFEKLWATARKAGAAARHERRAAQLWLVAWILALSASVIGIFWGPFTDYVAYSKSQALTSSASTPSPHAVLPAPQPKADQPIAATSVHHVATISCVAVRDVLAAYDLTDPSQHIIAKAALERVIATLPDKDRQVVDSAQREYLSAQWISGNLSAGRSKLIAALGC